MSFTKWIIYYMLTNISSGYEYKNKQLWDTDLFGDREFEYDLNEEKLKNGLKYLLLGTSSDAVLKNTAIFLPNTFHEFSISASIRVPFRGGYLFSFLNPLDTVVNLGLAIYPLGDNLYNISLVYTDSNLHVNSQNVASFHFPYFKDTIHMIVKVLMHKITLYVNCYEIKSVNVNRDPIEEYWYEDSKLYISSAGPLVKENFEGTVDSMKLFGDPDIVQHICSNLLPMDNPILFTRSFPPSLVTVTSTIASITSPESQTNQEPEIHNVVEIQTKQITPKSNLMIRLVALNEPYSGNLHGIRGADFACYRQAVRAGLTGVFKAFLSARAQHLQSLVNSSDEDLPVANMKGEILFHSWKSIFETNGEMTYQTPRIYSFNGRDILNDKTWLIKKLWHGYNSNGEKSIENFCDAWESASSEKFGIASSLLSSKLLNLEKQACSNQLVVLCIETVPFNVTTTV